MILVDEYTYAEYGLVVHLYCDMGLVGVLVQCMIWVG